MELRDYQFEGVTQIRGAYAKSIGSVLYTAPTGAGKTVLFSYICHSAATKGKRAWVLVHRQELVDQVSETLRKFDVPHGIIASGYPEDPTQAVQVCSVGTLTRRLEKYEAPDLIIIDEAHHAAAGSWQNILEAYQAAKVLGVTATPERLDGKGLEDTFEVLIRGPEVSALMEQGHLCRAKYFAPPALADLSKLKTRAGDYAIESVAQMMDKPQITGDAIEHYQRLGQGMRAIAFCATVEHAYNVAEAFTAAGIPAEGVDGDLDKDERRARVERFREGKTRILTNCALISEGFDIPAAGAAILLRPTQSLALHLQQVGRVLRPQDGKEHAVILDHVGNCARHGLAEDYREWRLEGREKTKTLKEDPLLPFRQCPNCYTVHPPAPLCPTCGHVHGTKRELEQAEGELREIISGVKTCGRCKRDYARHLSDCPRCRKKEQGSAQQLEQLIALGKQKGYHPGWAHKVHASREKKKAEKEAKKTAELERNLFT